MPYIKFNVNFANSVAFDVTNDMLPFKWMQIYLKHLNHSKQLIHAKINNKIKSASKCIPVG